MEDLKSKAENLTHHLTDLVDTYYKLGLIKVTEKATNIVSTAMAGVTTLLLFIITLFFLGMGLAWWLGDLVNSRAGGFFIVAAIFIIIMVVLVAVRKKIVFPFLRKAILKKLYE